MTTWAGATGVEVTFDVEVEVGEKVGVDVSVDVGELVDVGVLVGEVATWAAWTFSPCEAAIMQPNRSIVTMNQDRCVLCRHIPGFASNDNHNIHIDMRIWLTFGTFYVII
jgi:hypothetical protein